MALTRGYPAPSSGSAGGGITEGQHEALDTLVHALAENAYFEYAYTGKDLTRVTVWTDSGMTLKIRESTLSYTGKDLTGVVITQHNGAGTVVATLTKTLSYVGKDLDTITVVRS